MSAKLILSVTLAVSCILGCWCEFVPTSDKTYYASTEALNWTDAKNACASQGLELVSILNENEKSQLESFLRSNKLVPSDKWSGYWTSGIRYPNGTFIWVSTGTQVGERGHSWLLGEPNHSSSRENCIELKYFLRYIGWNDYFCDEARRYLCQLPRKEIQHGQELDDYSFLSKEYSIKTILRLSY